MGLWPLPADVEIFGFEVTEKRADLFLSGELSCCAHRAIYANQKGDFRFAF